MSTELTINKLLPVLISQKLSERSANVLNTAFVGIDFVTSTTVVRKTPPSKILYSTLLKFIK